VVDDHQCSKLTVVASPWSEDRAFLPATTVYSLTFVLGILGNGFVILALCQ